MKKLITFFVILLPFLLVNTSFGQQISPEQQAIEYRVKAMKYDNLKGTGTTLMIVGGISFFSGIGLMASSEWYTDAYGYRTTDDPRFFYGLILVPASIIFSAAGTVFHIIGRKKSGVYMEKAKNISVQATANGIGISLKF
ncbi:MAG: hypothetical protein OEW67_02555 [Cyclobacteriaceae bacterium]|nr:hypothetical protein [Cyclobacteriaceae bacterium]